MLAQNYSAWMALFYNLWINLWLSVQRFVRFVCVCAFFLVAVGHAYAFAHVTISNEKINCAFIWLDG